MRIKLNKYHLQRITVSRFDKYPRRFLGPLLHFLIILLLSRCATVGAPSVQNDRVHYNEAIVRTNDEQLLLNLVRLRYRDSPFFLSVQNVTSRYTLNYNGNVRVPDPMNARIQDLAGTGTLTVGGSLTESPTVVYRPVSGEQFIRELLSPIPPENIALLAQSGWSIERILLLCVQALNNLFNAPSASGPTPDLAPLYEEFSEFASTLRLLQRSRSVEIATSENGDAILRLFPNDSLSDEISQIKAILQMDESSSELVLNQVRQFEGPWMRTRSPIGVMQFIAQSIEVPQEHYDLGIVTDTVDNNGDRFDWDRVTGRVVAISSQKERPDDAFLSVPYRDWWFYISDSDLNSKTTFSLLSMLISMQSGRLENTGVINTISLD